jgi:thioredoxin-like negative regulator of GroEL
VADTLGWVLVGSGEPGRGLALIEEAYRGMPDDPQVRYHLAVAYNAAGRPELARPHLEALLDGDADFPERAEAERLHAELRSD